MTSGGHDVTLVSRYDEWWPLLDWMNLTGRLTGGDNRRMCRTGQIRRGQAPERLLEDDFWNRDNSPGTSTIKNKEFWVLKSSLGTAASICRMGR